MIVVRILVGSIILWNIFGVLGWTLLLNLRDGFRRTVSSGRSSVPEKLDRNDARLNNPHTFTVFSDSNHKKNQAAEFTTGAMTEVSRSPPLSRTRRSILVGHACGAAMILGDSHHMLFPTVSATEPVAMPTSSVPITDRIFFTLQGLPNATESNDPLAASGQRRVVIGLFGKLAPYSVGILKQLFASSTSSLSSLSSSFGYPAPCRPSQADTKALEREQLQAERVYRKCLATQDAYGVTLQDSTIWRIIPHQRIDVGAVTGKFVARQYPNWQETENPDAVDAPLGAVGRLRHDKAGVVSVRRGQDGGFGFTIYTGSGPTDPELDRDHIVVGRVLEGMDVIQVLDTQVPIISTASGLNLMGLTGGPRATTAPDRSCSYGGNMYCNENKPLLKLTLTQVGVL